MVPRLCWMPFFEDLLRCMPSTPLRAEDEEDTLSKARKAAKVHLSALKAQGGWEGWEGSQISLVYCF